MMSEYGELRRRVADTSDSQDSVAVSIAGYNSRSLKITLLTNSIPSIEFQGAFGKAPGIGDGNTVWVLVNHHFAGYEIIPMSNRIQDGFANNSLIEGQGREDKGILR
jgi:hypothetical protein